MQPARYIRRQTKHIEQAAQVAPALQDFSTCNLNYVSTHHKYNMNSIFKAPVSSGTKITLVFFVVASIVNFGDFIFYVQEPRKMISAIGYALMAYGTYKSSLTKEALDLGGRYGLIVGFVLVVAGFVMKYLP